MNEARHSRAGGNPVCSSNTGVTINRMNALDADLPSAKFLRRLAAGENFGQSQPHKGRQYQVKQRGLRHEQQVDRLLRVGLSQGINPGRRVTWFTHSAEQVNKP